MPDIIQYSPATDLSLLLNLDQIRGVGGHFHMTNDLGGITPTDWDTGCAIF